MFGIVTDDDFETQLATLTPITRGRGDKKEVPIEIKKLIASDALNGSSAKEIAENYGVSESSVSAYKNDATSTASYNKPNEELKKNNDVIREKISGTAREKLTLALDQITNEKLADAKLKDVASVAKDMSAIIRNMEPQDKNDSGINQQFIFMTPAPRQEKDFEVIEVRD